jgi:hypothetical protein
MRVFLAKNPSTKPAKRRDFVQRKQGKYGEDTNPFQKGWRTGQIIGQTKRRQTARTSDKEPARQKTASQLQNYPPICHAENQL